MNKPNIVILVGPPGSGKSTLSKSYVLQGYTVINQDDQGKAGHMKAFNEALAEKKNIVIDRMNFNKLQRSLYLLPAQGLGYETEIVVLYECHNVCLHRCIARIGSHPTVVTEKDARAALNVFFRLYEAPGALEADKLTGIYPDINQESQAVWIDIDNTLADGTHRHHLLRDEDGKKNWKAFFGAMDKDIVNSWCKELVKAVFHTNTGIFIVSARPEDYRDVTEKWLRDNQIPYDLLLMRHSGDYRQDAIVKEIIYDFEILTRTKLLFSVDDRKQVIDRMRGRGVTVLDCAGNAGEF